MLRKYVILALLLLSMTGKANGQDHKENVKAQAVKNPREIFLPVIPYQPDCPLKLEPSETITYLNGGDATILSCRNQGTKPIRAYTVAWLNSLGGQEKVSVKDTLIAPGESEQVFDKPPSVSVIPLTENLRKKLKLDGPMKAIVVFIVVKVEYTDGSVYEDEKVYSTIKDYFEKPLK